MKRLFFLVCLFYCFFRLQIYKAIAAIFWQSASYVDKYDWGVKKENIYYTNMLSPHQLEPRLEWMETYWFCNLHQLIFKVFFVQESEMINFIC